MTFFHPSLGWLLKTLLFFLGGGLACPRDPRSSVVEGCMTLVGSPGTNGSSGREQTKGSPLTPDDNKHNNHGSWAPSWTQAWEQDTVVRAWWPPLSMWSGWAQLFIPMHRFPPGTIFWVSLLMWYQDERVNSSYSRTSSINRQPSLNYICFHSNIFLAIFFKGAAAAAVHTLFTFTGLVHSVLWGAS